MDVGHALALVGFLADCYRRGRVGRLARIEVLRRRYAEGEISTEEYEERKRRLQSDA